MYADRITPSMALAIDETTRRRAKQVAYNEANGIDPTPLRKRIADVTDMLAREDLDTEELLKGGYRQPAKAGRRGPGRAPAAEPERRGAPMGDLPATELAGLIQDLTDQMHGAAGELQFELAARLRDEISGLKRELRQMQAATR